MEKTLTIRNLRISFQTSGGTVRAVRGVDLDLYQGETLAIVGESGSGKSVTVKAIMGIVSSNQIVEGGTILYRCREKDEWTERDFLRLSRRRAIELLELVGIPEAEKWMRNYPHQLFRGMRQRVVIAIALSCSPDILICDEPATALDVTIQAKILELIQEIQWKTGISVIYITHDLGVVAKVADYVAVMYAGRIAEKGTVEDIFYDPRHPYTWGLLSSMPDISDESSERLYTIPGSPPSMVDLPAGDPFAPRNAYALEADFKAEPPMFQIRQTHFAASWLLDERAPKVAMPDSLRRRIESMRGGERTDG